MVCRRKKKFKKKRKSRRIIDSQRKHQRDKTDE
jgi:hypothetical protein